MAPELLGDDDLAPQWLERAAELWGQRVGIADPDTGENYSYTELRDRARAVARGLAAAGVVAGDRLVTLMANGITQLDALFACAYLGAILVPLNWRLSERELGALLADVEPQIVLTDAEFAARAQTMVGDIPVIVSSDDRVWCGPMVETLPETRLRQADPWLILYTGGTTGVPKGAVLTHGSIVWNAINTLLSWGLSAQDSGPSFTPMFHTGGFNVFTLPLLLVGGRVILPRRFAPDEALLILERERPSILFMVPTMFQQVAEQPGFDCADLSSIRWAISGGAPLPESVRIRWQSKIPIFKQGYGLTEVGPNNFATADEDAGRKPGTVGRLTLFARARIVDNNEQDVPDGTPGELLLAGSHMCAGYWRRPEATADAIRQGWFHTGDIARRDDDGFYFIVDRKKDMIITGGENVYPTEVEAALYEHPAIREAAVVGTPDELWGEAVCAVVALQHDQCCTVDDLRAYLRANLAHYKVPKRFLIVEEVPKSAAGKLLRSEARRLAGETVTERGER